MASPLALPFRQLSPGQGIDLAFTTISDVIFDNDSNVLVLGHHGGGEKIMRVSHTTGHGEIVARLTSRVRGDDHDESRGRTIDGMLYGRADSMAIDTTTGDVYITDHAADGHACRIDMKTGVATVYASGFRWPVGIAMYQGVLYVADEVCISRVAADGKVTTWVKFEGSPKLLSLTIDPRTGVVYVCTRTIIYHITPGGVISVLAGCGKEGHGDGNASKARFSLSRGIALDVHDGGSIVVADTYGFVRRISQSFVSTHTDVWHAAALAIHTRDERMIYARYGAIHDTKCCDDGQLPLLPQLPEDMKWNGVSLVHFSCEKRLEGKLLSNATFAATYRPPPMASSIGTAIKGLVLRVMFNIDSGDTDTRDRRYRYEREFALAQALSQSAGATSHIVPVYHSFEAEIVAGMALPDMDHDDIGKKALFAVTPYFPFTLQQLLAHRLANRPLLSSLSSSVTSPSPSPSSASPSISSPSVPRRISNGMAAAAVIPVPATISDTATNAVAIAAATAVTAPTTPMIDDVNGVTTTPTVAATNLETKSDIVNDAAPLAAATTSTTASSSMDDTPPVAATRSSSPSIIPPSATSVTTSTPSSPAIGNGASPRLSVSPTSSSASLSFAAASTAAATTISSLPSSSSSSPSLPPSSSSSSSVSSPSPRDSSPYGIIPSAATRRLSTAVDLPVLLTNNEVVHLGYQLAVGLHHLHHRSIAHRDVKPDAILLLPPADILSQSPCDIKLMDERAILCSRLAITNLGEAFDANDLGGRGTDMKMSYNRADISKGGHTAYLAPEVIAARPTPTTLIDYGTNDAFSLGCVLFNMMSVSPSHPFDVVRDPHRQGTLPLLSTEYSSELRHIVKHLLISDPRQRLPLSDAVHLLADLLRCHCGSCQPQQIARPLSSPYPPKQCLRCGVEFGIFHRRYYCSSCQHCYCAECSTRKAPSSGTATRLCEWCYRRLY